MSEEEEKQKRDEMFKGVREGVSQNTRIPSNLFDGGQRLRQMY